MSVPDELESLAAAAARGDREALGHLIRATQRDVVRFLAPVTTAADLQDLVQETYLRVVRSMPGFAGRSGVRTWLFTIARRVAADHVRQLTRRPRLTAVADWQTTADAVAPNRGARLDELQALDDLVAGLSRERREAFLLTQVAGLSYAEAAEVCDCPVGTIRSRVARAREELIALLREAESGHRRVG